MANSHYQQGSFTTPFEHEHVSLHVGMALAAKGISPIALLRLLLTNYLRHLPSYFGTGRNGNSMFEL